MEKAKKELSEVGGEEADEELKKKIVDILVSCKSDECAADALIAAGLKFDTVVSHTATFDLLLLERINKLESQAAKAEHRAEMAERALRCIVEAMCKHVYDTRYL